MSTYQFFLPLQRTGICDSLYLIIKAIRFLWSVRRSFYSFTLPPNSSVIVCLVRSFLFPYMFRTDSLVRPSSNPSEVVSVMDFQIVTWLSRQLHGILDRPIHSDVEVEKSYVNMATKLALITSMQVGPIQDSLCMAMIACIVENKLCP